MANPSQTGRSSVSAWAEPLAFVRQSVGMVAADMRFWCSPDPPPSPSPKKLGGVLWMRAQSWSKLVNDGRAFRPSADWIQDHQAGLELRAHRCARQRVVLILPLGVGG